VRAGSDDVAIVGLISPRTTGSATLTASVNNLTARRSILFTHAFPDDAVLSVAGSFRLTASFASKAILRAELTRSSGTVTRGTEVAFEAVARAAAFGYFNRDHQRRDRPGDGRVHPWKHPRARRGDAACEGGGGGCAGDGENRGREPVKVRFR
jgi:hypothetical protein